MVQCKNCRWWSKKASYDEPTFHYCNLPSTHWNLQNGIDIVEGEPCNSGSIATGPEFGCIHGVSDLIEEYV